MTALLRGLAAAWRRAGRSPAEALVVIVTLGVALSALAAMFAVVEAVILRPLPYRDPGRVVAVWEASSARGLEKSRISAADFVDVHAQSRLFESGALFGAHSVRLLSGGEPEQIEGARAQPDYFRVLGVQPALGRAFSAEDARPGAPPVVILGHGLFQRRFGGRPELLGRTILLDGEPCTVVGVMPPRLYPTWPLDAGGISFLPQYQQFWVPLALDAEWLANRRTHVFGAVARLRPEVTLERARRELAGLGARLAHDFPATNRGVELRLVPLAEEFSGSSRRLLLMLVAAAALIVCLAAANLAGLALSRALARRHETAVRVSLGASRAVLAREAVGEALALALAGAALGLLLARAGGPLLAALVPLEIPRIDDARVGWLVVLVTLGAAALCAGAVGLAQAFGAAARSWDEVMRRGGLRARDAAGHRWRLHRGLVVAQVGVSVVLLSLGGLFAKSFVALLRVDAGVATERVLTAALQLPPPTYREWDRVVGFQRELISRLAGRPGVVAAALAYDSPLESSWIDTFSLLDPANSSDAAGLSNPAISPQASGSASPSGAAAAPGDDSASAVSALLNIVSPDFYRAAGLRLESGRTFEATDDRRHPGAAVVSRDFARLHFPAGGAVGHRLRALTPSRMWPGAGAPTEFRIVGVAGDVRNRGIDRPGAPTVYLPAAQFPQQGMTLIVRLRGDPLAFAPELRRLVAGLDPGLPIARLETLVEARDRQMAQPRFALVMVGAFGGAALILAALGVYGLLTLVIGARTHEIAVRLAVGARPADVAGYVIGQACRLTAIGAGLGILGALGGARAVRHLLYDAGADDALITAAAVAVLFAAALIAASWPIRRAIRIDPMRTLRN